MTFQDISFFNIACVMPYHITTVDGVYKSYTLKSVTDLPDLRGCPHYVGHPYTRAILEKHLGVVHEKGKFEGLKVGESFLATPLKSLENLEMVKGWSEDQQVDSIDELKLILITKIG